MMNREEVARIAGVSTTTVTRVVTGQGYVSEKTRKKVLDAVKQFNYKPNLFAQNLRRGKSNIIVVLAEDLCNTYTARSIEVMAREAQKFGYTMMLYTVTDHNLRTIIDEIVQMRVYGVINLTHIIITEHDCAAVDEAKIKTVNFFYRGSHSDRDLNVDVDYAKAMREAFERLQKSDKHRPIFIGGLVRGLLFNHTRVQAFCELSKEFGWYRGEDNIFAGDYPREKYQQFGYRCTKQVLENGYPFDSVFCLTDTVAVGVLRALHEARKRIPEDVAVIGCDNMYDSLMTYPALTSIDNGVERVCAEYIRFLVSDKKSAELNIEAKLVCRETL